jgi:uncharacterized protein YaaQ
MKLIVAVVQDKDSNKLSNALSEHNVRATKLASTGGFLRTGNTTFLIGVEDDRVKAVLKLIEENCMRRTHTVSPISSFSGSADAYLSYPVEVMVGGAKVFVMPIESVHSY